jgi:hypothetical protein
MMAAQMPAEMEKASGKAVGIEVAVIPQKN